WIPRSIGSLVVSYTAGTAPHRAIPPLYLSMSSSRMSFELIGGMCEARHVFAGLPYFAVASALCRRHQYRVPPSLRRPTAITWHSPDESGDPVSDSPDENRVCW